MSLALALRVKSLVLALDYVSLIQTLVLVLKRHLQGDLKPRTGTFVLADSIFVLCVMALYTTCISSLTISP